MCDIGIIVSFKFNDKRGDYICTIRPSVGFTRNADSSFIFDQGCSYLAQ